MKRITAILTIGVLGLTACGPGSEQGVPNAQSSERSPTPGASQPVSPSPSASAPAIPWSTPPCKASAPRRPAESPPAGVSVTAEASKPAYARGESVSVMITLFNGSSAPVEVATGTADGKLLIHDGAGLYWSFRGGGEYQLQYIDSEPVEPGGSRRLTGSWNQTGCSMSGTGDGAQVPPGEYFVAGYFQGGPETWPVWYATQASFRIE